MKKISSLDMGYGDSRKKHFDPEFVRGVLKVNGVTKEETAAIITHATMYCGWPKGWAVFRLAQNVWTEE